jgi:hypothetical protein
LPHRRRFLAPGVICLLFVGLARAKMGMAERLGGIAVYPFWETNERESKLIARSLGR